MNPRWLAIPALMVLAGCKDPAARYRNAAKQLTFTLEQVEPNVQLAYPIEQSRLDLKLTVKADNPTNVRFKARNIRGDISLDTEGTNHFLGQMGVDKGVDLAPGTSTPVVVDLSFSYRDLRKASAVLKSVVSGNRPGVWHLDGEMGLDVLGIPVTVPLKVKKQAGVP